MSRRLAGGAALVAVLAAGPAAALVLLPADLATLAREADAIAHGRVIRVEPRRVPGRRAVERVVVFAVERAVKGEPGSRLSVVVPGGEVPPYRTVLIGAPEFAEGDEAVLFVAGAATSRPHVVGLSQGVFRVVADPSSGRRVVIPPAVGGAPPRGGPQPVVRGDPRRRAEALDDFLARVEATLRPPRQPRRAKGER